MENRAGPTTPSIGAGLTRRTPGIAVSVAFLAFAGGKQSLVTGVLPKSSLPFIGRASVLASPDLFGIPQPFGLAGTLALPTRRFGNTPLPRRLRTARVLNRPLACPPFAPGAARRRCWGPRVPASLPGVFAVTNRPAGQEASARRRSGLGSERTSHADDWGRGGQYQAPKSEFRRPKPERRPNTEGRSHARAFRFVLVKSHATWLQLGDHETHEIHETCVLSCVSCVSWWPSPLGSGSASLGFRPSFGPRVSGFGFGPLRSRVGGTVPPTVLQERRNPLQTRRNRCRVNQDCRLLPKRQFLSPHRG
jgi:hypothetical protein